MNSSKYIQLADGCKIPQIGLGVWQVEPDVASCSVETALRSGYRHVDTAAIYGNEVGVGNGLRLAGVDRGDLFVTTKVWNEAHGFDATLLAFRDSLGSLKLDYVDLYLIHWPSPKRGQYLDTWRALIELKDQGKVRSIGVSNFEIEHLKRIVGETGIAPSINQIELHPRFQQKAVREFHQKSDIQTQSWSPLGQGQMLANPTIEAIASKHGKTPAQAIIRWHIQNDLVVIPKSVTPNRIVENLNVYDFELDQEDMAKMAGLDSADGRIGPNPMTADF